MNAEHRPDGRHPSSAFTFLSCISDDELLNSNLLASPCLAAGSGHDVILVKSCTAGADGLSLGIRRAKNDWVVCLHQDVFLPEGWDLQLARQLEEAERQFGPIGVAGVYGVGPAISQNEVLAAQRIGRVCDRGRLLDEGVPLPALAATLDELLLVVPKLTPLEVDPELGFHLYGADLCLQAAERGLAVVVIDAYCHHNSRNIGLPPVFFTSAEALARKWHHRLPVATPCVIIDTNHKVFVLGNSPR